ncbi:38029_t:CDS:2 [Gigaspora margarita]|uniref:38029_t:CDS:1 n=1 Tax=Gigaspora margarita TaxID=4874 RepID=A0ABN7UDW4_GIGMA|nr:38029_t:CDS:2 [Gigaspora margarita]
MWILLEGKKSAVQVDLEQSNYKALSLNLDRLMLVPNESQQAYPAYCELWQSTSFYDTQIAIECRIQSTQQKKQLIMTSQFNNLVARIDPNSQGERFLDLKIQIKEENFKLDPPLNDDDLKWSEYNLREKMIIFHNEIAIKEAIARELIFRSFYLWQLAMYKHVMIHQCDLRVKVELDGSHGYVTETKSYESEKTVAHTLVQIHSSAESLLGKQKQSEQTMFEIKQEYPCIFENDMKETKKVLSYIVRVLQAQAKSLNKDELRTKRLCTDV